MIAQLIIVKTNIPNPTSFLFERGMYTILYHTMLLLNIAGHLRHRGGAADLLLAVQEPAYEEFARLAETRLAQNTLDYLKSPQHILTFNVFKYILR